jgi:hypothetical protein
MLKIQRQSVFTIADLAERSGLDKPKVRYYLRQVLQDYIDARGIEVEHGKTALYPKEVLSRLVFIKMAKEELETTSGERMTPSLAELRGWMNNLADDQVEAVLAGDDTLGFGVTRIKDGKRVIETVKGERLPGDSEKYGARIAASPRGKSCSEGERASTSSDDTATWARERFGPVLEIRYGKPLSERQLQQLRSAGELLRNILGGEE